MRRAAGWQVNRREVARLVAACKRGDRAASLALLNYVDGILKVICNYLSKFGCSFDDLHQQACVEFYACLPKWDPKRGLLKSYVFSIVRAKLAAYSVQMGHLVHVPARLVYARDRLEGEAAGDVARAIAPTHCKIDYSGQHDDGWAVPLELISITDVEADAAESERAAAVKGVIAGLTGLELVIARERFMTDVPTRQEVIARRFGCTRQYVSQVEIALRERLRDELGGLEA